VRSLRARKKRRNRSRAVNCSLKSLMKLIVGLGNPGKKYEQTRHNIGQAVVKELAKRQRVVLKRGLFGSSLSARCRIKGQDCLLAAPLSYMNLSGSAVKGLVKKHKVPLEDLIVIHDELDLEAGKLKVKSGGSSGGHNGLESVIGALSGDGFCRLRIGIGKPQNRSVDISDYVLSAFAKSEKPLMDEAIDKACETVELWVELGEDQTMNITNR
jgi:peptidyl-tRNA hydrolase, PTH1 family